MARKLLEWQLVALLLIGILFGGKFAFDKVIATPKAPTQIGINSAGKLTSVTNIVVAEQHQTFARFVDFKAEGIMKVASLGFGKAKLYFQWEAKNNYGVRINERQPVEWHRTKIPGEIEISAPPLELLDSKIYLEPEKYLMLDIEKSIWVNEEAKKSRYRADQVQQTTDAALAVLTDPQLIEIAGAVVGDHIKNVLNQGLTSDKIHTARVEFRSPQRGASSSSP